MRRLQFLATLLAAGLASTSVRAAAEVVPPAVSKECGQAMAAGPLPNTAAALQQRKHIKVLAIGASPTAVLGPGRDGSPLLERILERTVKGVDVEIVNRGFSGELAEDAGERIRIEVALNEPDIVLWQVGTDDAFAQVPVDSFERSVSETVRWLKEHGVDVILVGLHYAHGIAQDTHYQAIRSSVQRVAIAENVLRIGRYQAMRELARTLAGAGRPVLEDLDLTEAGYNCMAQHIARAIAVGLFAKTPKPAPAPDAGK